jgi:hypothetical protein
MKRAHLLFTVLPLLSMPPAFGREPELNVKAICKARSDDAKIMGSTPDPLSALVVLSLLCVTYFLVDPLPPRRFVIATGAPSSFYENFAKQYQRILARYGVTLEVRKLCGCSG